METDFSKKLKKKKTDKSDFSTDKKKKDLSDFAGKNKIKTNTSKMKNTFSSDAGVKPKASSGKTTFSADTNIAKISSAKKDKSDFAGSNKTKTNNKTKTSSPSTFGAAFKAARKKQGAGGTFTYKGKKYSTNRADDKKKTKKVVKKVVKTPSNVSQGSLTSKKPLGSIKPVSSLKSSRAGIDGPSSSVKKKTAKTGFGSKAMTTKVPKKTRQGITRTPLQAKRKRRSMMGST